MLFQDIFVIQRFTGLNLPLILLYHGCPDSKEAIRKSATESLITSPLFLNAAFWARHFTVLPLLMRKCRVLITRQEMPDKKGGKGKGKIRKHSPGSQSFWFGPRLSMRLLFRPGRRQEPDPAYIVSGLYGDR